MTTRQIDFLNIGLMFLALGLALKLPFELFLFSYAVLGPLHYLTEIGWLHERDYFATGRKDYFILVAACFLIFPIAHYAREYGGEISLFNTIDQWDLGKHALFVGFVSALGMILFKNIRLKIGFVLAASIGTIFIMDNLNSTLVFAVFLPTIIHVFLFTMAFMLFGALKSRSLPGLLSVFILIGIALSIFAGGYDSGETYKASAATLDSFEKSTFADVIYYFAYFFGMLDAIDPKTIPAALQSGGPSEMQIAFSNVGVVITKFFAFAYTYHYLNWFSKTSIINWHKVPRKWLVVVVVLWVASVILYRIDYGVGLTALLFLSMLHVFLEFPLNYRSFIGIVQETRDVLTNGWFRKEVKTGSKKKKKRLANTK